MAGCIARSNIIILSEASERCPSPFVFGLSKLKGEGQRGLTKVNLSPKPLSRNWRGEINKEKL